jgi:hypothetical protein
MKSQLAHINKTPVGRALLSIFVTVATVFCVKPALAAPVSCTEIFQNSGKDVFSDLLTELGQRGFTFRNNRDQTVARLPLADSRKTQKDWQEAKKEWLQRAKSSAQAPLPVAQADLIEAVVGRIQDQGFSVRLEMGKRILLIAIDNNDAKFRRDFDVSEILSDHARAITELNRLNNLSLTRLLVQRSSNLQKENLEITEAGLALSSPLRRFAEKSDADLQGTFKEKVKILSKKEDDLDAGFEAALIAGEMLLRKGFKIEILPSGRATYVTSVVGRADGQKTELTKIVESVRLSKGGWFAMDPTYYSRARNGGGVSDSFYLDYSLNTDWLWNRPESFEGASNTLLHEIFHISNAQAWLDRPEDEFLQSMNGLMWASGKERLGKFGYPTYLQLDEIQAAFKDSLQAETDSSKSFYRRRALDLAQMALKKIPLLRWELEQGNVVTFLTNSGNYLQASVTLKTSHFKSESGFAYFFPDLDLNTPQSVVIERFQSRLDVLEHRLQHLEARIAELGTP